MKLLFIYGPPAAGKLTVAQHIAERTNFRLFHNHLTIDLARELFEDRQVRSQVIARLRLDIVEAAAKANVDLIFTMVYAKTEDDGYVSRIVAAVEDNGGEVCFVQLVPDAVEIEKRVVHPSRQPFSKIKTPTTLREAMAGSDLYGAVPYPNNLAIDNTDIDPAAAAKQIIEHFGL